jgi:hypothetical protein
LPEQLSVCSPVKSATVALLLTMASVAGMDLYISPAGSDAASGMIDAPFASLPAALRAARKRPAGEPCTIWLRAGTYELAEPVVLTPEDSGLAIAAYRRERPVLSGGRRISGWKSVGGVWETEVKDWYFRSLFVNGRRAVPARTPNVGSFFRMQGERLSDKPVQFKFARGDIQPHWLEEPDSTVVGFEKWTDFRQHIRALGTNDNVVRLSGNAAAHTRESGARYFVENTADSLDAAGEWRLDRATGILRYRPLPGEHISEAEVTAPRLSELFVLKGDLAGKKPIRGVVLRGVTFSHTDWVMPNEGYTDSQAAVHVPGDLRAEATVDCVIENCVFEHLGGYAIEFGAACQRNRVVGNTIRDIAAGGIRLGVTNEKNPDAFAANHSHLIIDNHLHALGRVNAPAVGVLILQSGTNRVAHNHIHDLYYTAISVGWNWGYQETPCRENIIEFNHMHDIGQGMLSDMGAVYTLGIQHGTVVRNNLIHDVNSFTYGGWGLYPDEGSSSIVWENNIVYRTKSAGFHQHYGRENIVRNNIFAFGKEHQIMRTREEAHISFIFTNNIVYFDSGTLLGSNWKNEKFMMENNIYFDTRKDAEIKFAGASLEQWRGRGHDTNSLIADPLFVAPGKADFRLKKGSPALKRGFRPIDPLDAGVRRNLQF